MDNLKIRMNETVYTVEILGGEIGDIDFAIIDSCPDVEGWENPKPDPEFKPESDLAFYAEVEKGVSEQMAEEAQYRAELQFDLLNGI
jgi:hypothetical protein